jgi:hypothetical protein
MLSHRQFQKLSILERLAFKRTLKTYGICNFSVIPISFSAIRMAIFRYCRAQLVKKSYRYLYDLRNFYVHDSFESAKIVMICSLNLDLSSF